MELIRLLTLVGCTLVVLVHTHSLSNLQAIPDAAPVNVSLYYESLCPGCRLMLATNVLPSYFILKSSGILNLHLYPYGNAQQFSKPPHSWRFECQHGPRECEVNMLESCALHLLPPHDRIEYIKCVEETAKPSVESCKACAVTLGVSWEPLFKCFNGSEGEYLEHEMAVKTDSLSPPHQYVPWFTVNGAHTEDIQDEVSRGLLKYVCKVYKGTKPKACHPDYADGGVHLGIPGKLRKCYRETRNFGSYT